MTRRNEIWDSGVLVKHVWGTFAFVAFNTIWGHLVHLWFFGNMIFKTWLLLHLWLFFNQFNLLYLIYRKWSIANISEIANHRVKGWSWDSLGLVEHLHDMCGSFDIIVLKVSLGLFSTIRPLVNLTCWCDYATPLSILIRPWWLYLIRLGFTGQYHHLVAKTSWEFQKSLMIHQTLTGRVMIATSSYGMIAPMSVSSLWFVVIERGHPKSFLNLSIGSHRSQRMKSPGNEG